MIHPVDASRTLRIGGASAFWGDSTDGPAQLVDSGEVDFLVFDYLAETTMAILAAQRRRDPAIGYATDFVETAMRPLLAEIARRGIRVVANAGGLNPRACAAALQELVAAGGLDLRVGIVEGDDVAAKLPEWRAAGRVDRVRGQPLPPTALSANAYLGAFPIAAALDAGADIVVTGRCVDSAVTLGPLIHAFGWRAGDFDRLAAGSLAGHLIECACQATGGLHTDWEDVPDWPTIGYPVVEVASDGSFTLGKPPGTGGVIRRAAVAEQLLYEIGDPADYRLPDVTCDFSHVRIEQVSAEQVRVSGARGRAPGAELKVSMTWADGWRCAGSMVIIGIDAVAKARRTGEAVLARTGRLLAQHGWPAFTATHVEVIGAESMYGPHARAGAAREVMMRVVVDHPMKEALEVFAREIAPAGTSWAPGTTSPGGGRPAVSPVVRQAGLMCPRADVVVAVRVDGLPIGVPDDLAEGTVSRPSPGADAPMPAAADLAAFTGPVVGVPLVRLAWARSGDKGDLVNIGVIARRPDALPWLLAAVTPEVVHGYFAHLVEGPVQRFDVPGIDAVNFVLHRALGGGGTSSMRMDPLGKGFAQMLLDLPVRVPAFLLDSDDLAGAAP